MSSFYDDASLVVIPSGYKTSKIYAQKPTDGSGDLTFTRASGATRVASNGLIEKVRTNLCVQSNTFSTTWTNDDSTETSGQTGYDGTSNAWLLSRTGANGRISQTISVSGSATFSIYVKAGTKSWVRLASSDAGVQAFFNLSTGAIGTAGAGTIAKITSAGNGYYRCSISGNASFSFFNVWIADADNDTTGATGNILIQNAQVETGDIATNYIPTTTAAVSVGPVSNVPRLDYLGSSCPRLLLEPQRTNISGYIESGTGNYTSATVTNPSNPLSILGLRSFRVTSNYSLGDAPYISNATDYQNGITYTASAYFDLSATNATSVEISMFGFGSPNGNATSAMNISTKAVTVTATSGAWSGATGKATLISGSIYRLEITATAAQTLGGSRLYCAAAANNQYVEVAGIQIEAGAYATSFISKSTTASVTRVADAASKTGISSLIGQTEGTLFAEIYPEEFINGSYLGISDGANIANRIIFGFEAGSANSGFFQVYGASGLTGSGLYTRGQRMKVAIGYKSGNSALYVNGNLVDAVTTTFTTTLTKFGFDSYAGTQNFIGRCSQAILFKTRLTNAQLAELTTL